ncbi:MAG: winged helix DNA-binding domain-containing protein [Verrucomicrobiales bacterium]|jgi:hypothetical protein|nr:winged helix DNA-binding domain-containing protein [Verrucomicrobiales bacterium]
MNSSEIAWRRLANQQIGVSSRKHPGQVVGGLGAMQAQDYPGLKWSVALRLPGATEKTVEQAIDERKIVRTWLMRGTLHLAAAEEVRWMLQLFAPRIMERSAKRRREIGLDEAEIKKCESHFIRALQGNKQRTRDELSELLRGKGIPVEGPRAYHIFWRIALGGLICFGLHQGKQPTFALLEEWVPKAAALSHEEALTELAKRYFTSHGPATLKDFTWWSGLNAAEAKQGLAAVGGQLQKMQAGGMTYYFAESGKPLPDLENSACLLPGFDEYILGYNYRGDVLESKYSDKIVPGGNGMFLPTLVLGGKVAGTWKKTFKKERVEIEVNPFAKVAKSWHPAIEASARNYAAYMGISSAPIKFTY